MQLIQEFKHKKQNKVFRIYVDEYPESPREWDNIGKMICFHKKYNLGDKHDLSLDDFNNWRELEKYLIKELKAVVILPLYMYDHSGITISTEYKYPYNDRWDSGVIGFIYCTKEDIKKEKITKQQAIKLLIEEIKVYDMFLRGEVYCFELVRLKKCKTCGNIAEEILDSCCGFYGDDNMIENMFANTEEQLKDYKEVEV